MRGKFLFVGDEKLYVRGVTYGTFRPDESGNEFHDPEVVERDFALMAANGINAVRTYTVPPLWLLDLAGHYGLRVMIGIPWEQHIAFLDDRNRARDIEARVRMGALACAGNPAVLCYAIGNEIPAPIVRWYGHRKVERFIQRLYQTAKSVDPDGLVTYVNYPTTEYLDLPFLDLACCNVYLESQERLEAYLYRLQDVAAERPLLMTEIGLDSRRNGEQAQAYSLYSQVRTAFGGGCAGTFVFSWTDEWHRGSYDIEDWDFGLTSRDRRPKPALAAARQAFGEVPYPPDLAWPRISVVVCSYNGERTIRECLDGLRQLRYPDFEVIVVDDGSSDATASIAREYGVRVISTENCGLSSARNVGLEAATGEIVAYIDDDAYPDADWLTHLAATFINSHFVGVGGPNIPPNGDGLTAQAVANAPGGPIHVLLSDREAEHIPGCNMAFRKEALEAVGGFDAQFRCAGDDVDVCWRLQQQGLRLGYSPAAMVWHHRRNSIRSYWKQQQGYGKAEALLERKWPEKYNSAGHRTWSGRVYGNGHGLRFGRRRIYQGIWGTAPFQSLYQPAPAVLGSLPLMPEWHLLILAIAGLAALSVLWAPLLLAFPLLLFAIGAPLVQAGLSAVQVRFPSQRQSSIARLKVRVLTALLHLLQPLARLYGRLRHGLTPWRRRAGWGLAAPWPRKSAIWSERWRSPSERLQVLESHLLAVGAAVRRGGHFDRWDLEARGGLFGSARIRIVTEEHGGGKQLARYRAWPKFKVRGIALGVLLAALSTAAAVDGAISASVVLGAAAAVVFLSMLQECATAMALLLRAMRRRERSEQSLPAAGRAAAVPGRR